MNVMTRLACWCTAAMWMTATEIEWILLILMGKCNEICEILFLHNCFFTLSLSFMVFITQDIEFSSYAQSEEIIS